MNTNAAPATTTYWVKQILAEGRYTASADGVSREFTPALLTRIVENFDPNPNNEVPLMFSDPTGLQRGLNRAGTLTGLEFRPTEHGVWGHFDLLPEGADYVSRYPQFGVSAHVNNDLRIEYLIGTVVPAITGMAGWERAAPASPWEDLTTDLQSAEEEPEQESQYEEVSLDLSEPQPQPQPQLNRGSRVKTAQSQRAELIAELKRYGIDVTANGRPASDDLLVHLAQKCRAGLVNQARSEYRTGMAQHRVRLQNRGTDTQSRTADLSYSNPQEGNTMSNNNIDADVMLRLENFVARSLGVSATGMPQSQVIDLAMQASVGREREYAEALTGMDVTSNRVDSPEDIRAWLDNNGV